MSRAFESLRRFYLGAYYPIFSALLILLGHATGAEVPFAAILLLSMVPAFFLCNDIRFAVLPLLCLIFTVSAKDYKPHDTGFDERYLNAPVLITAGIVLAIVLVSLVIFAVRNAAQRNSFPKNGSLFGLLAFSLALLLNGLFSSNYILKNLLFGAIIALTLLGVYWLFASYLRFDRHSTDYLMYCLVIAALLIAAELILAYFTTVRFENGEIVNATAPSITAQCFRVPVTDGHTAAVFMSLDKKVSAEEIIKRWNEFRGPAQELELPSAPKQFLHYFTEADRPQAKLDRDLENGMAVSIGRLRPDTQYDFKFVYLSHNTLRGAAGGGVLMAELLAKKGYFD